MMKIADDEPIGRAATGRRKRVCLGRLMTDSNDLSETIFARSRHQD